MLDACFWILDGISESIQYPASLGFTSRICFSSTRRFEPMFSNDKRTRMFKKIKSLLDTKIGICSSSERSMSERLWVSTSIQFTDWDDLPKLLYVLYRAELRSKRQNAGKPGRREGAVTASPKKIMEDLNQ